MTEFIAIVTSLPAAPFTLAAAFAVSWWAISLAGGLGGESDGHDVGDGHGHDLTDGHPDAHDAHDTDVAHAKDSVFASLLGLGKVPITLWATMFSVSGWVAAFGAGWLLRNGGVDLPRLIAIPLSLAFAAFVGAVVARVTSIPLAPVFATQHGRTRTSLVGETAEITTGRVDGKFGQARVLLGGDDLVVQVRCDRAGAVLARSHKALIVAYDTARDAYVVEPIEAPHRVQARAAEAERT